MRTLSPAVVAVALLALLGGPAAGADPVPESPDEATYYLALGDSLAAGYQPIGREDDHRTRMGYPDQLWLMARASYPDLELVNLGCPGEDTASIRSDEERCPYPHGSQLAEALAFIDAHLDQLAFITIDLGFSDFDCTDALACLFPGIERIEERLPAMLAELRAAAPGVPIVGMNIYDPYLTMWLGDDAERTLARQSVVAIQLINEALEGVYADAGIPVADVESAFAIDDWETLVPLAGQGQVPRNLALLCERTWTCFPPPLGPDRHPNVLGARAMAEAFAAVLGLQPVGSGQATE
jgi:lysophospholipase L1-like esterase